MSDLRFSEFGTRKLSAKRMVYDMVMSVLTDIQAQYYPESKVVSPMSESVWSIQHELGQRVYRDRPVVIYAADVKVFLEMDDDGEPSGFRCVRYLRAEDEKGRMIESNSVLATDALRACLTKLHQSND